MYTLDVSASTGGGSVTKSPIQTDYVEGTQATVTATALSGYRFDGWGGDTSGNINPLIVTVKKNRGITAKFKRQFTLTYNGNGNSSGNPPRAVVYDTAASVQVAANSGVLQLNNFDFDGWNTKSDGLGSSYTAGTGTFTIKSDVELFAKWKKKEYQVSFDAHGGTAINPVTTVHGSLISEPTSTRSGLTLVGWYRESGYTNRWNYAVNTVSSAITLHAKWAVMDIDGNEYDTVRIGNQTWMVQNLRVTKFRDGNSIKKVENLDEWPNQTLPAFCWTEGNVLNGATYGALYNPFAARATNIAPEGWHVPTLEEWDTLSNYLTANGYKYAAGAEDYETAKSIAGKTGWVVSEELGTPGNDPSTNNVSGFSALPSGHRYEDGSYAWFGEECLWWTTSSLSSSVFFTPHLTYSSTTLHTTFISTGNSGISIRCIKD